MFHKEDMQSLKNFAFKVDFTKLVTFCGIYKKNIYA